MSCITGALVRSGRIGAKDRGAELGTGLILPEGRANATQTEDTTNGGGSNGFEGLAA